MPLAAHIPSTSRRPVAGRAPTLPARLASTARAAVLAIVLAAPAGAQEARPGRDSVVTPGMRVRISRVGAARLVGTVVALRADSVLLDASGGPTAVPLSAVELIEVSHGRKRRPRDGAGFGFLAGVAAGAMLAAATHDEPPARKPGSCDGPTSLLFCAIDRAGEGVRPGKRAATLGGGLMGGMAGLFVGTLVGASLVLEEWKGVPLARDAGRLGVVLPPRHRGPGLGVALAF